MLFAFHLRYLRQNKPCWARTNSANLEDERWKWEIASMQNRPIISRQIHAGFLAHLYVFGFFWWVFANRIASIGVSSHGFMDELMSHSCTQAGFTVWSQYFYPSDLFTKVFPLLPLLLPLLLLLLFHCASVWALSQYKDHIRCNTNWQAFSLFCQEGGGDSKTVNTSSFISTTLVTTGSRYLSSAPLQASLCCYIYSTFWELPVRCLFFFRPREEIKDHTIIKTKHLQYKADN